MKNIKKILFVLVVLFAFVLVGCGGDKKEKDKYPNFATNIELQNAVRKQFDGYLSADHGSFKITTVNGEVTSTVDMIFNYELNKGDIISQAVVTENANGTLSCYIKEGIAYIDRYGLSKNQISLAENEGVELVEKYTFEQFAKYPNILLNSSFFKALTIDSQEAGVVKATLDINNYDISTELPSDELTEIYDGIKEKEAVKLEVGVKELATPEDAAEVTYVKVLLTFDGVTKTIEVDFRGMGKDNIEITYPDFTDYVK